ncbi:MAG: hypothetical protein ACLP7A_03040 [Desulfobaccales bacterium]
MMTARRPGLVKSCASRPGVYAGFRERAWPQTWLVLRPQNLVAGVGCHPGVAADEILRFFQDP